MIRQLAEADTTKNNWASGEMADTLALGASGATRGGSNPLSPTKDLRLCFSRVVNLGLGLIEFNKSSRPVVARRAKSGLAHQRLLFSITHSAKNAFYRLPELIICRILGIILAEHQDFDNRACWGTKF